MHHKGRIALSVFSLRGFFANCRVAIFAGCVLAMTGCRASPASLALMFVGDAISDAEVKDRAPKIVGKPGAAADAMFGERVETIETDGDRVLQVYEVKGEILSESRYVVETRNGTIVALTKTKYDADGVEDLIEGSALKDKLIGRGPAFCSTEGELGRPVLRGKSLDTGEDVYMYDVKNWTNLRNARYAVLRFRDGKCSELRLIGVSASTKKNPIRK